MGGEEASSAVPFRESRICYQAGVNYVRRESARGSVAEVATG
jgi:hypothetical protein